MASDPAQRRLAYILSDETYGPALARLRGEDERRVLDLIEQNRGKEARRAILEADERRRERERERARERRTRQRVRTVIRTREQREANAVANILALFGRKASAVNVRRNVGYMTDDELDFTADANEDSLTLRASRPADRTDTRGKDINPFWYH